MTDSAVRVALMGPSGGGKTTLAQVLISGQSAKSSSSSSSSSPSTQQAIEHSIRVPIIYEGKPVSVSLLLIDLPGADAPLHKALAQNPKIFLETDLALLCVPPTNKQSYVDAAKALDFFKGKSPHGKVLCYLTKSDEPSKYVDGKTAKSIRAWTAVAERLRVLGCESLSSFDTSSAQIGELLKKIATEAHKASLDRLAAEAEVARLRASGGVKSCCVVA